MCIRDSSNGRDPVDILEKCNQDRVPELIPIRYGRMLRSPFTLLRGSAALMAYDLASLPSTGIQVQACGDCHLLNFGYFATPERNLVFDLNDFDETHPAPWEWDIKRLAASIVVAGRDNELAEGDSQDAARSCVRSYREHLRQYSIDVYKRQLNDLLRLRQLSATVVTVADANAGLAMLEEDKVDAYAGDKVKLVGLAVQAKEPAKLALVAEDLSIEPYAMALPRNDSAFRLEVNKALTQVYICLLYTSRCV